MNKASGEILMFLLSMLAIAIITVCSVTLYFSIVKMTFNLGDREYV